MGPYLIGYFSVIVFYGGGMLMAHKYGIWVLAVASITAVAVGMSMGRLRMAGITLTIFVMSVVFPIVVLTIMGLNVGIESPLRAVISDFSWMEVIVSLGSAVLTYFLSLKVKSWKSKGPEI